MADWKEEALPIAAGILGAVAVMYIASQIWAGTQSRKEMDHQVADLGGMIVASPWEGSLAGEHHCPASLLTGPQTVLPHRYPSYSGVNLSVLMQHGFQPLYRDKPQDYDYLVAPPSEGA